MPAKQVSIRTDGVIVMSDGTLRDKDPNNARALYNYGCVAEPALIGGKTCNNCKKTIEQGEERWFDNKAAQGKRPPLCTPCKDIHKEHKLKSYADRDKDGLTSEYWQKLELAMFKALCRWTHWRETPVDELPEEELTDEERETL